MCLHLLSTRSCVLLETSTVGGCIVQGGGAACHQLATAECGSVFVGETKGGWLYSKNMASKVLADIAAMDEALSGLPCSTCRLLDAEGLKEEEEEYKATLLIFVLPGVAMLLMGLR